MIFSGWTLRPSQIHGNLSSCPPVPLATKAFSRQKPAPQDDGSFISYIYEHLTS